MEKNNAKEEEHKDNRRGINLFETSSAGDVNTIDARGGKWIHIEAVVDSGACDTVASVEQFPGIPVEVSELQKAGVTYHGLAGVPIVI